jgi:CheY-like chemotaxis protein
LIWPLLVVGLAVYLYLRRKAWAPEVRKLIQERNIKAGFGGLHVEIGGQVVPAKQAVDDQRKQTEQLRQELSLLAAQVSELGGAVPAAATAETELEPAPAAGATRTQRVLWVDDQPSNNSYEIAALKDRKVDVTLVTSTAEALRRLAGDPHFDGIVTDMHRNEDGNSRDTAGLTLLTELRERQIEIPAVVYASQAAVERHGAEALELGAVGATANPTALLELLAVNYGPGFRVRFKREVETELERSGYEHQPEPNDSPIDYMARRNGDTLGVDVKSSWGSDVPVPRLRSKFNAVEGAHYDFPVWIVTPEPLKLPPEVEPPEGVDLLSLEELRARLRESAPSARSS